MRIITLLLLLIASTASAQQTFRNPLLPAGADPWVIHRNGWYYYMNTTQNSLEIRKTKNLASLKDAERKVIWTPPASGPYSKEIWAPELHYLQGKWYVYFAADDGNNDNHRIYALENSAEDPTTGSWTFKGKIADPADKWAIDGSVFEYQGKLYMTWSGWEGDKNGQQDIFIAEMADPLTITGKRVKISSPTFAWEKNGDLGGNFHVNVNEGPQILRHGKKVYLVYSASGCWTDTYALGMLTTTEGADLLDPRQWKKWPTPVFAQSPENKVYAPGHNSFFTSPDGKEHWILYHANDHPGDGCGEKRSPRMQPFYWNKDGIPIFGKPLSTDKIIKAPRS
jgi:GH43 family beta-xylosidase